MSEPFNRSLTNRGAVIAELVKGNPRGRLKAVEYSSFGGIVRVEWYDGDSAVNDGDDERTERHTESADR